MYPCKHSVFLRILNKGYLSNELRPLRTKINIDGVLMKQ